MAVRIGINGFGRIGRMVLRAAITRPGMEIVKINDLTDTRTLAHLLKYDSVVGNFSGEVGCDDTHLIVNGKKILVSAEKEPSKLAWADAGVTYVVESTGKFTERTGPKGADQHLAAGAKKVIIAAPAKGEDATFVIGVNHTSYDPAKHHIVSNASCTTNCLAPAAKVVDDLVGIKRGLMTTIHSYTNDQVVLDFPHRDLRRARAAALSMIPTTTGAAKAVGLVLPHLNGKLNGFAIRVPTPNVSVVDLVAEVGKPTKADELNAAFKAAAEGALKGILAYCDLPLVSSDFRGDCHSSIVDGPSTMVIDGTLVKIIAWYDNEWAYSLRVVDLIEYMASKD